MKFEEYDLVDPTRDPKRLENLISEVCSDEDTIIVRKDGKTVAVIIDWETFQFMTKATRQSVNNRIELRSN